MAQHRRDIDSELNEFFDVDDGAATTAPSTIAKPTPTSSTGAVEDDVFKDLENMAAAPRTSTSSRPQTPRLGIQAPSTATSTTSGPRSTNQPILTPSSGRSSEEAAQGAIADEKASGSSSSTPQPALASAGSWWGGISTFAAAAITQAQAAVKEIQKNEEAQKLAEQVRGNYGALRGLGGELRSRALPTFTNLIHTLAPPISQHERLQIHTTHDLIGYPSLDPLIFQTFSRVMSQVEGGDLLVIQRGSESTQRRPSDAGYTGSVLGSSGWGDGPWWRDERARGIGAVKGLVEGTKLVRVSAESYGNEFFSARGGLEEAAKRAAVQLSENNPVRSSDIFLAIQAINHTAPEEYFAGSSAKPENTESETGVVEDPPKPDELITFAIYLHDPVHDIAFSTLSQSFPQKWADWLDARAHGTTEDGITQLPPEIVGIIEAGGVDPREWVAEWIEETLSLGVGIIAQRYVARRMGVGEGGIGRGKQPDLAIESGGGEAARAL